MFTITIIVFLTAVAVSFSHCSDNRMAASGGLMDHRLEIPAGITDSVYLFDKNSFTPEKAALGRYLFYDRRLSVNSTKACASCHAQEFSFTDNYHRSSGAFGDLHQRNSRPLFNLVFNKYLTAANPAIHFPEQQIQNPMMGQHPIEMGISGNEERILKRLRDDKQYYQLFAKAFPGETDPFNLQNVQWAICSFIKTIFSFHSAYDRYTLNSEKNALTPVQQQGMQLFFSDSLQCQGCHGGINFSTPRIRKEDGSIEYYFNTGLYNIDSNSSYPELDHGLSAVTNNKDNMGKFRVPTLRNLVFTAPYYHDGSAASLEEVIKAYEDGGRNIVSGSLAGDGRKNKYKHPLIKGFRLNSQERTALVAFLLSLSDSSICNNPAYASPFTDDETK